MAVTSRGRTADLQMSRKWKEEAATSPERNKVWTEPPKLRTDRKVPVVYYLSRNGQLEHPHFMEVPLPSPEGLYLRDVINRLNLLRGKGMATMYSWSSKRSYKNGFVWHDLAEDDFIYPVHGQEYVLKGSELLDGAAICKSDETVSFGSKDSLPESRSSGGDRDLPIVTRRRNQSMSAIDFHEYKVYKAEPSDSPVGRAATDASTQTDEKRRRRRAIREIKEEEEEREEEAKELNQNQTTELRREEISPPPSDSSPETLESLMKADGRLVLSTGGAVDGPVNPSHPTGRIRASSVLMQLISCGSISFKDCGPANGKDEGFSLISHYKGRLPRGVGTDQVRKDVEEGTVGNPSFGGRIKLEDKEYFSGSLIETKKPEFPALKRSSSYNADRSSHLNLMEKEIDGVKAKCIPRKPKAQLHKVEVNSEVLNSNNASSSITTSNNQQGSKKSVVQPQA